MSTAEQRQLALQQWIEQLPNFQCENLTLISGDASFRRYFRFISDGQSFIAVDAPPEFEDAQRFIDVAKAYSSVGVNVPTVFAADINIGFYVQSDLGNRLLSTQLVHGDALPIYRRALDLLPNLQSCIDINGTLLPTFGRKMLSNEYELFTHWLLNVHLNISISASERAMLDKTFAFLTDNFVSQPQVGVHRDYHSRNIMFDDNDAMCIIDFQDAVIGPLTYDAVSLLRDCYQDWPDAMIYTLLKSHWQAHFSQYPWEDFRRWFDLTGIQRHVKASGIFARLWHRDGKAGYLPDIPLTLSHLSRVAVRYPECTAFGQWVSSRIIPALGAAA